MTCTCSLKKVWKVEFLIFLIGIVYTLYIISLYLDANKFLRTSGFKCIDPKESDFNKYTSNISKGCVLEVEYPKELR